VSEIGYDWTLDIDPDTPGLQVFGGEEVPYWALASDPNNDDLSWEWSYQVTGGEAESGTRVEDLTTLQIVGHLINTGDIYGFDLVSFVSNLTFDEFYAHFERDTLLETLLETGFIRSDITDVATLKQRLLGKGFDIDALKLRPDGVLSAIGDIRGEGSLYIPGSDWVAGLMMSHTAKDGLEALFYADKFGFLDHLSVPGLLRLLGAESTDIAGNTSRLEFTVVLDTLDPVVEFTSTLPTITNNPELTVAYTVDGVETVLTDIQLEVGENEVVFEFIDSAGNPSEVIFQVTRIAETNAEIVQRLVRVGMFDSADYDNLIAQVTFPELLSEMNAIPFMKLVIDQGFALPEINTVQALVDRLAQKGVDVFEFKLRPDGILSSLAGIGDKSLLVSNNNLLDQLSMSRTVKEAMVGNFNTDRQNFIENLELEHFLSLLGGRQSTTAPTADPIWIHTWEDMDGDVVLNPARALFDIATTNEWGTTHDDAGQRGDIQALVDQLIELPEGKRILFVHSWSYLLETPDSNGWKPILDPLRDDQGIACKGPIRDLFSSEDLKAGRVRIYIECPVITNF